MKGSLFAFLGALCQGAGLVLAKKGMEADQLGPIQATAMRMIAATFAIYLIGLVGKSTSVKNSLTSSATPTTETLL